jgi:NTE family protein
VKTAFVLGGGGHLGAAEVGMLHALLRRGVSPDLVVGTSVGALHGAVVAASPSAESVVQLEEAWGRLSRLGVVGSSWFTDATILLRTRTHVRSNEPLRRLVRELVRVDTFAELAVEFQCVAASIERAAEHWFQEGPLVDAILASSAVPGILPPVRVGDEHFMDGGLVNSVPLDRAIALGAEEIFVLHVGRLDQPLSAPRRLRDVAMVAFEVARRHRFVHELANVPDHVTVHVLPTGDPSPPAYNDLTQLRYRSVSGFDRRIAWAAAATDAYLAQLEG